MGSTRCPTFVLALNNLGFNFFKHLGYSCRIESLLATPVKSSIQKQCYINDHPIKLSNFSIVTSTKNVSELRLLEPMYIQIQNPILNEDFSSLPLYVV